MENSKTENINIDEKQSEMERIIKIGLNSKFYQSDENCFLFHLKPEFVSCSYEKKELQLMYHVQPWEMNPQQSCHGGVSAAMIDTTMGLLTHFFAPESFISTVSLTVNYLKPIPVDTDIITRVWANSWGRTIVSLTADIYIPSTGIVAATAVSTYIILRGKRTQIPIE
jgi:acyl-CoA thioesterase